MYLTQNAISLATSGALSLDSVTGQPIGYAVFYDANHNLISSNDLHTVYHYDFSNIFTYTPVLTPVSTSAVHLFLFDSIPASCGTGTFSDCVSNTESGQYVVFSNIPQPRVVEDTSTLAQQAQQVAIGGDSFSPQIMFGGLILFLATIAFIMKYLKSKV